MDTEVNGQGVLQLAVVSFYLRTLRSWPQVTIFLCKLGKLKEQKEQKMNGITVDWVLTVLRVRRINVSTK